MIWNLFCISCILMSVAWQTSLHKLAISPVNRSLKVFQRNTCFCRYISKLFGRSRHWKVLKCRDHLSLFGCVAPWLSKQLLAGVFLLAALVWHTGTQHLSYPVTGRPRATTFVWRFSTVCTLIMERLLTGTVWRKVQWDANAHAHYIDKKNVYVISEHSAMDNQSANIFDNRMAEYVIFYSSNNKPSIKPSLILQCHAVHMMTL